MKILQTITYISLIAFSTTWTIFGIKVINKLKSVDDFKNKTEKNIKNATDKISTASDKIIKITNNIFKGSD